MTSDTTHETNAGTRLLTAVSLASSAKAALVLATLFVPAWRLGSEAVWGMSERSVLPITILTCVLYVASGEAARRRVRGALWFVVVVHGTALFGVARAPEAAASLPFAARVGSVALSLLIILLVLLPPARRALRPRGPAA